MVSCRSGIVATRESFSIAEEIRAEAAREDSLHGREGSWKKTGVPVAVRPWGNWKEPSGRTETHAIGASGSPGTRVRAEMVSRPKRWTS